MHYTDRPKLPALDKWAPMFEKWYLYLQKGPRRVMNIFPPAGNLLTEDGHLSEMLIGGEMGFFLILVCLVWWREHLTYEVKDVEVIQKAHQEIAFVLGHMVEYLKRKVQDNGPSTDERQRKRTADDNDVSKATQ